VAIGFFVAMDYDLCRLSISLFHLRFNFFLHPFFFERRNYVKRIVIECVRLGCRWEAIALFTANIWAVVQPSVSLFGLQHSDPFDTDATYGGIREHNGTFLDHVVGLAWESADIRLAQTTM